MATAEQYAEWLVQNQSKKGTPDFETVASAYRSLRTAPAPQPTAPSRERTYGEAAKDIGAGVVSGIGSLVQLPGQLYGLATGDFSKTGALGAGEEISKFGEEMKSAGLKAREAERAKKVAESAKEGQLQAFGTALGETVKDPALLLSFIAEQAPQLLVPFGAARGVGMAARGLGATEAVAGKAAVRGAVGAGGVQQGSDVGAGAYENIYKELKSKGASDTEAAQGALTLARQAGAAAGTISLLAQRLPGARQLEEVLAGVPGKGAAGLGGRLRSAGSTAVGETVGEIPEEVGGKFVSNLAMQQVKPEQSLTEGLGEAAAMATIGGVGLGGAAGLARRPAAPEVEPPPPVTPEQPPAQPALQQQVEAVTGVTRPEATTPEMLTSEEANRQRLLMLQQKADAESAALATALPESPQEKAARAAAPPATQPSLNEQMPQATPLAELQAKQAEIDRLRLEAGLPTGASSKTPGVQPEQVVAEETPVPKIVDNRPLEERAANNRLLVMKNMLQNQGGDPASLTIVPHPTAEGRFAIQSLDVPVKFGAATGAKSETGRARETTVTRLDDTGKPYTETTETPSGPGVVIDPIDNYVEIARRTNTPASMRLVRDFEAGIVTREDIQAAIDAEKKAGMPLPLNYQGNGEPWFLSADTGKPRGERILPVSATLQPTPEGPVKPPITKPAAQVYAEMEPPASGTTGKPVVEPPVETPPVEIEPPKPINEMPKTLTEFKSRMPVESENPEVRDANKKGDFAQLAEVLAKSTNPAIRRIGQLARGVSTKIKLKKPGNVGENVAGIFRYADDSIQMDPMFAGDEHTNAHETLHGLISRAQRFPTAKQKPTADKIFDLYEYVKKEMLRTGKARYARDIYGKRYITVYGLTNEREFTAEAMTNPEFQYELMQISYGGRRSAWTEFTRLVAELLGITNTNALTEVMNLVDKLAQIKQPRKTKVDKGLADYEESYVTQDEIYQMQRDAFDELNKTDAFKQVQQRIKDAQDESDKRYRAVMQESVRLLKENPQFKAVLGELSETQIQRIAMAYREAAEKNIPMPKNSEHDALVAQGKLIEEFFKKKGIPEPRQFSNQANQDRPYYSDARFKKWFGNSKAVNKDGKPVVAFHTTDKNFKIFNVGEKIEGKLVNPNYTGKLGSWFTAPSLYEGEYEAGNAENAVSFFEGKEGDNTMLVHLSIQNPMEYEGFEDLQQERDSYSSVEKFKEALIEKGYDGVVVRNSMTDGNVDRDDWVAFYPTQIKSAIGNTGEFSTEAEEIDRMEMPKSVKEVKEKVSTALQKNKPLTGESLTGLPSQFITASNNVFKPQNKTIVDKLTDMQDRFWQRLAQGIADQYRTIKDYSPVGYMQARLSKSVDGALEGILFNGHVFNDGGALNIRPNTKGLIESLKPLGNEVDRYQMWVALNRESRLPEEKRSRNDDMDYLVANRAKLAEGTINGKSRLELYNSVLNDMNALNKSVLDVALDQGLIDQASYDNFAGDMYYIPFYRQMEEDVKGGKTPSGLTRQNFSKALKGGGDRPFGDLMENTLRNWSHILSASMKNQAAVTTIKDASKLDAVEPNLKSEMAWENGKVVYKKTGEVVGNGSVKPEYTEAGPDTVTVKENGQTVYYTIKDPLLLESITSIGYLGPQSKFLDVSRDFKNMLQYGVTMSPAFKVNNLFRDSVQAMAVSDLKKNPFANVVDGWISTDKNNPAHISALAGGAIFNFGTAYEGNQSKLVKRLIAKGVKESDILDTPSKIKAGMSKLFDKYEELGNKSEAANRMALYNQLREAGFSHLEASFQARDLMDFSMQGSFGAFRYLTQVVPFMNARIQGLYKLGRDGILPTSRVFYNSVTGKEIDLDDKKKAQAFSIITSAVCLASLALYGAFKDDEEFQKRSDWDRDNFWWIRLPGMEAALRIPKPFEIGALGTIAERTAEQIFDADSEGKQFTNALSRMMWDTFAMNPMPQIIKPVVDLYANKDSFTGAPIETAGMEALSKAERKADTTSPLAIALAPVLNIALPEKGELSPVQVDYAIKGYFGWLGGTIASTSMYAVMPFKEGEYPDTKWMDKASLGFVKSLPSNMSQYTTAFYESNKQIQQAFADMRHYAEIGEMDKVEQIMEDKGDKIALQKLYTHTSKQMANIRKQISIVTNDKSMDGATKREEIDRMKELISMLAKQAEDTRKSYN
jgi:hypothetical protein